LLKFYNLISVCQLKIKSLIIMKKQSLVLLTLTVFFSITSSSLSQNCTYGWYPQNSGTPQLLYTCKAVNELVCWAAGANATVLRTTDGGINWLNANPNPGIITGDVRNMEALDDITAFVTTESQTITTVYKTTDGGDSWFVVYSNIAGSVKGIRMLDSLNGIAIGSPVSNLWNLLLTTDGGNTWQPSPNRPPAEFIHQAVNNSFQVSMPYIYWGTSITTIFRSTDGGITFNEYDTPGAGIYILSLFINAGGVGLVASTAMSRSTDGGITFQPYSVPGGGNINAVEYSDHNFWYIRGEKIYHSSDDGASWTDEYTTPSGTNLNHMDFPDNLTGCQMGWAVGFSGSIYKLTNSSVTSGDNQSEIPRAYQLSQNYPNPFNPTTKIEFSIADFGFVSLKVYDALGNEVATLVNEEKNSGTYEVEFSAKGSPGGNAIELPSGVYFYRLVAGKFSVTKKMILLQ
jgi:photosystem II stability/assembly factor-like uncharacterized protein